MRRFFALRENAAIALLIFLVLVLDIVALVVLAE
jgi:hypothetical protein